MNFINGAELLEYCEKENKKISEAMFERETTFLEQDPEKTRAKMKKAWSIMQASAKKPLKENIVSMGGMIGGESRKLRTGRWGVRSFGLRKFAVFADRGLHDKGVPPLHRGLLFRNRGKYSISACRGGADVRSSPLQSAPIGF